jgi:hypothetical protein
VIFRRAHKVWLLYVGGEKKEEEAQYMPEARSVEVCFGAQKQKKHTPPRISLFTSLFDRQLLCVRVSLRTGLFFSLFSPIFKPVELEIPPF